MAPAVPPEESLAMVPKDPALQFHSPDQPKKISTKTRVYNSIRINPKLLPVKLLIFLVYGAQAAVFPYITVHMKSIGINITETAIILLLLPIVTTIGPSLSGAIADRIGNYKLVLIVFMVISVIFNTAMWFAVPAFGQRITPRPQIYIAKFDLHFPCYSDDPTALVLPLLMASKVDNNSTATQFFSHLQLQKCSSNCSSSVADICFYTLPQAAPEMCLPASEIKDGLSVMDVVEQYSGQLMPTKFHLNGRSFTQARCECCRGVHQEEACFVTCKGETVTNITYHTLEVVPFGDRMTTISLYFVFRFLSFTATRGVFPLLDAAAMEISKEHGGDFGVQRLFSSVGNIVIPPLSGWLTAVTSNWCACQDFSPAFYLFAMMTLSGAGVMAFMDIRVKKPQTQILRTLGIVLRDPNVLAFIIAIFFTGAAWGAAIGYLFLFMEDDKDFQFSASPLLLGLVNTVGYILGIPLMFFSTTLINTFGHENMVAFGLLCYAGRFLAYSFTYNPYLIYPTEMLTAVTLLIFILAVQYALKTSRKYLATLVGLFGAANFGIGGGVGPLIAGLLIHWLGYRPAFRILAGSCAVAGTAYLLVFHFVLKKLPAGDLTRKINDLSSTEKERAPLSELEEAKNERINNEKTHTKVPSET